MPKPPQSTPTKRGATKKQQDPDAPVEISSKKKPSAIRTSFHVNKSLSRDPRFDPMCGKLDRRAFDKGYRFLHEMREQELLELNELLKKRDLDPSTREQTEYLAQKYKGELKERRVRMRSEELRSDFIKEQKKAAASGKKPRFLSNSDLKTFSKIARYEDLKDNNRLDKYLEKKRKTLAGRTKRSADF